MGELGNDLSSFIDDPRQGVYVDWANSYRWLIQHSTSLPHSVLTGVQVQSLVLQDLPLPHDVLHLPVKEPGEGRDHPLISGPDVLLLQESQSGEEK